MKKRNITVVMILVAVFMTASISSILKKSPTCDEAAHHIPAGYVLWKKADLRFSTETPPLPRYIMSAPMLMMKIILPDDSSFWRREDRAEFSRDFLYVLNKGSALNIIFFARLMMILVTVFGGVFLYSYMKKRYDDESAILSALFYFLSPNIIAHGRLATTDITFTVFGMMSIFFFWEFLEDMSLRKAVIASFFSAMALLSKFSAVILIFMYVALFIGIIFYRKYREKQPVRSAVKAFGVFCFFTFLIVWAGYSFEFRPLLADTMRTAEKERIFVSVFKKIVPFAGDDGIKKFVYFLNNVPVPMGAYILGLLGIFKHGMEGSRTYFMGKWSQAGNPAYYITAFFIKTPLPVILTFFTGIFAGIKDRGKRPFRLYLLLFITGFFILASRTNLQLGLRYILVVYPLVFVFSGIGTAFLMKKGVPGKITASVLIIWLCVSSLAIWPHYLSYFNETIGGPDNGYKFLRDSNIDWGQDLPALKSIMDKENIDSVTLAYFGEGDPSIYGIKSSKITEREGSTPGEKVYAISVQYLDRYEWAKDRVPDAKAGYSIYIYDLRRRKNI